MRELDSRQLADWMAYYRLEPYGERAADLRHGIQTAAVINRWRNKHERTYEPQEFTLTPPAPPEQPDEQTLLDKIKAVFIGVRK